MGRIIRNQLITSTHQDLAGEKLSHELVRSLFKQIVRNGLRSGVEHDLSQSPITRMLDARLEELPDGELAIKLDLEVLDERRYRELGGYSISFTRTTRRYGRGAPLGFHPLRLPSGRNCALLGFSSTGHRVRSNYQSSCSQWLRVWLLNRSGSCSERSFLRAGSR